jgi:uncharacterized protein (DUF305 family)
VAGLAVVALIAALVALLGEDSSGSADDGSGPRIVQAGAPGEPTRELTPEEAAEFEPPAPTEADVWFMQGMIHHHGQALEMTDLVPARHRSDDIVLIARRIELSQRTEIVRMKQWLRAHDERVPGGPAHDHASMGPLMPGMLTTAQFDRLEAVRGAQFDRLFLELMIQHHRGALVMVRELRGAGGAVEVEAGNFATDVEADQRIEITRMREMLAGRFGDVAVSSG